MSERNLIVIVIDVEKKFVIVIGKGMLQDYKYAIIRPNIWISHTPNLHETEHLEFCKPSLRMM